MLTQTGNISSMKDIIKKENSFAALYQYSGVEKDEKVTFYGPKRPIRQATALYGDNDRVEPTLNAFFLKNKGF
jgi:hypothetical protein